MVPMLSRPSTPETWPVFRDVVNACPVPVVIAGGPKTETDQEFLEMISGAMEAGARGVAIGRNVFQHPDPIKMTRAITQIVHHKTSVEEALQTLK